MGVIAEEGLSTIIVEACPLPPTAVVVMAVTLEDVLTAGAGRVDELAVNTGADVGVAEADGPPAGPPPMGGVGAERELVLDDTFPCPLPGVLLGSGGGELIATDVDELFPAPFPPPLDTGFWVTTGDTGAFVVDGAETEVVTGVDTGDELVGALGVGGTLAG